MSDIDLQDAFNRVYLYLLESGIEMTAAQCRTLLQLLEQAVLASCQAESDSTVRECAVDMIPEYFVLPVITVPEICPPLKRGVIGYAPQKVGHADQ